MQLLNYAIRDLTPNREDCEDAYRAVCRLVVDEQTSTALQRVLRLLSRAVETNQYVSGYLAKAFTDRYADVLGTVPLISLIFYKYFLSLKVETFFG